jgi:arylsulfatase A-like enzyme
MVPMNLLWIFVDQLRYHSLSCHGEPNVRTPHIDRLAEEGASFTHAVSTCPVCTPARGAVMTGQYGHTSGIRFLGDLLPPSQPTVAHAFRRAGYRTSYVGKWHLASAQNPYGHNEGAEYWVHPLLRGGFEDWFAFELSNHFWRTRYCTGDSMWPPRELEGYQTDALTDLSLDYLSGTAEGLDQPWFHVVSYESPHHGSDRDGVARVQVGRHAHARHPAPPQYEARFDPAELTLRPNVPPDHEAVARSQQAQYCAMIANLDDNVGRVLDWLDESGQADRTVVVFFSDHGEMGGTHGGFQKGRPHAESLRVPLLVRCPGLLSRGLRVAPPANLVDIFPTSAALCGVPVPAGVQGLDMGPLLRGGPVHCLREGTLSQWFGNPRYNREADPGQQWRAVHTERYTYAVWQGGGGLLFDEERDPYQQANLFDDAGSTGLRRHLHGLLRGEMLRAGESVPEWLRDAAVSAADD